uniref:Fatty acid hydroxylase domain-containing protein n=1 Tax=Romanomermis culicivorax TaxID=13658 RepID=A0A915J666_ROMCU
MVLANSTIEEYSDIFTNFTFGFRRMLYLVMPSETTFPNLAETPNYVELSSPWIFIFIFVEMIISKLTDKKLYQMNDSLTSTCAGLLQMTMKTFFLYVEWTTGYWLYENYRLIDLPWDSVWTWILSLLCVDLSYYWFHRAAHEINFLWCFHQIHHSSEFYNFSTATRQGMVQQYGSMIFYLPECLFVPPQIHLAHMGLNLLYQFSVHTRLVKTLGPLEMVLNTPSHHRVHHGRNPYCVDKNYGGFLIVWDRIFGTFEKERDDEPVVYGLIKPINTFDQFHCQTLYFKHIWHKLRACKSLGDIWKTLFYNPSWSLTTGQYQLVPESCLQGRGKCQTIRRDNRKLDDGIHVLPSCNLSVHLSAFFAMSKDIDMAAINSLRLVCRIFMLLFFEHPGKQCLLCRRMEIKSTVPETETGIHHLPLAGYAVWNRLTKKNIYKELYSQKKNQIPKLVSTSKNNLKCYFSPISCLV